MVRRTMDRMRFYSWGGGRCSNGPDHSAGGVVGRDPPQKIGSALIPPDGPIGTAGVGTRLTRQQLQTPTRDIHASDDRCH